MTAYHSIASDNCPLAAESDHIPQLYGMLGVIEQNAKASGDCKPIPNEAALRDAARSVPGIAKRAFDQTASETAIAAAAGARALLGREGNGTGAATTELARYLRQRIAELGRIAGI